MNQFVSQLIKTSTLVIAGSVIAASTFTATSAEAKNNGNVRGNPNQTTSTTTTSSSSGSTTFNSTAVPNLDLSSLDYLNFSLEEFTGSNAAVDFKLYDIGDDILFQVDVDVDTNIADITGVFFDINEDLFATTYGIPLEYSDFTISGAQVSGGANNTDSIGNVNLNGGGSPGALDFALTIGAGGRSNQGTPDDFASTAFTLSHDSVDLGLDLFLDQTFATRLQSVGANREGSSKLAGDASSSIYHTNNNNNDNNTNYEPENQPREIPEPTSLAGLGLVAGAFISSRRRRQRLKNF